MSCEAVRSVDEVQALPTYPSTDTGTLGSVITGERDHAAPGQIMTHSVLDAGTAAAGYWSTISLNSALPLAMTDTWLVLSCISDVARHGAVWRRRPNLHRR